MTTLLKLITIFQLLQSFNTNIIRFSLILNCKLIYHRGIIADDHVFILVLHTPCAKANVGARVHSTWFAYRQCVEYYQCSAAGASKFGLQCVGFRSIFVRGDRKTNAAESMLSLNVYAAISFLILIFSIHVILIGRQL